jgi:hypothetical protein
MPYFRGEIVVNFHDDTAAYAYTVEGYRENLPA